MDNMLLLRLTECARSTSMGYIDKGSPRAYASLAALSFAEPTNGGYRVTPAGFKHLADLDTRNQIAKL